MANENNPTQNDANVFDNTPNGAFQNSNPVDPTEVDETVSDGSAYGDARAQERAMNADGGTHHNNLPPRPAVPQASTGYHDGSAGYAAPMGANTTGYYPGGEMGAPNAGVVAAAPSDAEVGLKLRTWSMWLFIGSAAVYFLSLFIPIGFIAFGANIGGVVTGILAKKKGDPKGNLWFWLNLALLILMVILFILVIFVLAVFFVGLSSSSMSG